MEQAVADDHVHAALDDDGFALEAGHPPAAASTSTMPAATSRRRGRRAGPSRRPGRPPRPAGSTGWSSATPSSRWDVAAGIVLVEAAGGRVTGFEGEPVVVEGRVDVIVSNGLLHDALVAVSR